MHKNERATFWHYTIAHLRRVTKYYPWLTVKSTKIPEIRCIIWPEHVFGSLQKQQIKCVANQESCSDIAQEPSRRSMENLWSAEICTELNLKSALVAAIAGWSGRVVSMQPRADSYSKKHSTFRTWPAYQRIKSLQYLATERVPFHPFHPFRYGSMPDSHPKRFQTCRPWVFGSSENHDENTACVWCVAKAPKISTFLVPCFPCPKLLICNSNKTTLQTATAFNTSKSKKA